ncbi:hypothetical protein SAVIM338S_06298 [Streptomyces avidinii]
MPKRAFFATAAATLALAGLCAAGPAEARVTPNSCGGVVSDYTGTAGVPVPFTGTLTVAVDKQPSYVYQITITSQALNSNMLQVNAKLLNGEEVSKTSSFSLDVDSLGRGKITFESPTGMGHTTGVGCTGLLSPTRVTKMIGKMTDPNPKNNTAGEFVVTRPAL